MLFKDIIGQEEAKERLIREAKEGKIAHARLFCGNEGVGKLPLAIAYAQYLSCEHPTDNDSCGVCPNCVKYNKLIHPDLHFVFPVIKKKNKDTISDDYLQEWREILNSSPYFNLNMWLKEMGAENQQAQIYVKESDEIIRKLNLKSSQGGYKVMIIWLPEKMNVECSNKLLKLLEEPPTQTIFILISEEPDTLLPTIQSRVQRFNIHAIDKEKIAETLCLNYGLEPNDAKNIAHRCQGNFLKALETIHLNEDNQFYFEEFVSLMRLAYQRKIREIKQWSDNIAAIGRERQKNFLAYIQRMLRESFIYNFHTPDISYLSGEEQKFSSRFSPFINEGNVISIMEELSIAEQHIGQNVNAKMVFFDLALKMIVLLVQK
jgi:DNA polymerase-3 subunit delta'